MPKYWGKQIFSLRRFPEVGQKQKREKKKDRTMVITMAKLRMVHASTHGARKPPGPKEEERAKVGNDNGQLRIATPPRVAHAKPPAPILRHGNSKKSRMAAI